MVRYEVQKGPGHPTDDFRTFFYIFIIEKLPKLKKIKLPKSQVLFSIFFKHPTLGSPPGPCRGRSMKKMHFLGSSDTILSIFVPLFA